MDEPKVKEKYKLVAKYYMGECLGNAEQSCIKAGYSPRYSRGNASKVVSNSGVQQYIAYLRELNAQNTAKEIATIQDIQEFWSNVMNNKSGYYETKDRLKASELLAKSQGAFNTDW